MAMTLFEDIEELLSLKPAAQKNGRRILEEDLGLIRRAAIVVEKGKIVWVGARRQLPPHFFKTITHEISLEAQTVLPGFVECHTHLVFAGDRAAEFELRNQGVSYQEIAKRGGGILSTMRQTRKASSQELFDAAYERALHFASQGVTCLESKSGYALNLKDEMKMLEVNSLLARQKKAPKIVSTFLGAHSLPPEFSSYAEYLDYLSAKVLPVVAKKKLAERVDIFIEKNFFPAKEGKAYLQAAQDLGFDVVVHADQLSLSGGSEVAVELAALSADHLVQVDEESIQRLAASEVVSVLLPAADLYMKMKYPPARALIDAGACVALATDFNPGSSPTQDLNLVGLLARIEMKMTLPEVIAAYTIGAATALKQQHVRGSLEIGKSADFSCTDKNWSQLFYNIGDRTMSSVYRDGRRIYLKR